MSSDCKSITEVLQHLDQIAPGVPLLALGQTIFWDEPMKAGVAMKLKRLGSARRFVAGIHDTDYFAKLPHFDPHPGRYRAVPHNDTTTRGLWSAAGEFSQLFGSETVATREMLVSAGLRIHSVTEARPNFLDEATEAWGWRGIVSLDEQTPVTAEMPLRSVLPIFQETFDWALNNSLKRMTGEGRATAELLAEQLRAEFCRAADGDAVTLSDFFRKLATPLYEFAANVSLDIDTTATTELLRFNQATCHLPRFGLLDLYVNQATRQAACNAYDAAIDGSAGLYELAKFGTGAIPFDLVIPGIGRGTIRLGTHGAVIMTHEPQFLTFHKPLTSVSDLASLIEKKFGPNCTLVGKAVSLIGMIGAEFAFVFHEGASSYVKHSRKLHKLLNQAGFDVKVHPIMRVRYHTWDALKVSCSWFRIPSPLRTPFGSEEMCAPSFADRWKEVAQEQEELMADLAMLNRPIDLLGYLDRRVGGAWHRLAWDYSELHQRLGQLETQLQTVRAERDELYAEMRQARKRRGEAERAKGEHFRMEIFEKTPSAEALAERERLSHQVDEAIHKLAEVENKMRHARRRQYDLIQDPEVRRCHERRRAIELEAELKRARMIREAVVASKGLRSAQLRPSAWWFRLVCPDGLWFRETIDTAECYLEPLI